MSITIDVEFDGLKELDEALVGFSNKVVKKALDSALSAGALPIMNEAKRNAAQAKEPHEMQYGGNKVVVCPGLLKESIRRRKLKKNELAKINAQAAVAVYIGKGTKQKLYPRYWVFIEYGTSKLAPTPFLRNAFDTQKENAVTRFKEKLASNIEKLNEL